MKRKLTKEFGIIKIKLFDGRISYHVMNQDELGCLMTNDYEIIEESDSFKEICELKNNLGL